MLYRILTKNIKTTCSQIFSSANLYWERNAHRRRVGENFLFWQLFPSTSLCLIFVRVWPIEDLLFEIRHLDKYYKLHDKFKYIHSTQSAQISQKHDGYNTYVIIENNVPSWLRGLNKHTGYRYLLIRSKCTSTYYTYIHTTQSTQILQKQDEYKAHM